MGFLMHVELLVVLAPALASVLACAVANSSGLGRLFDRHLTAPIRSMLASREHVQTIISWVENLGVVGGAIAAFLGFGENSMEAYLLGAAVALTSVLIIIRLSRLATALAKNEAATAHRKLAGTVRSIVKGELKAAARESSVPRRLLSVRMACTGECNAAALKRARPAPRIRRTPPK
jgi:hypothetical protein